MALCSAAAGQPAPHRPWQVEKTPYQPVCKNQHKPQNDPQRDAWRAAAEARLLVDSSLADMVVALTGDLARLVTPVEGP